MVLIESDVIGGAAHLWDCIPSKAMIATGSALTYVAHSEDMGLDVGRSEIDIDLLRTRLRGIENKLERSITELLTSQSVELVRGRAGCTGCGCAARAPLAGAGRSTWVLDFLPS